MSTYMNQFDTTPYVSTFSGNRFYPLGPRIDRVAIEDIAHGLAYQCRFNGQTREFYSVAQHSLVVASLVPPPLALAALLHDAAEAYLGDMVKPLKVLMPEFADLEERVGALIADAFGVDFSDYAPIKRADLIALATEKRDLMPHSAERWTYLDGIAPLPERIVTMSPWQAKQSFLARFAELNALEHGGVHTTVTRPGIAASAPLSR
jgi:5'-deoxynucleotidase YfbR-like HD superfamily hydrolase